METELSMLSATEVDTIVMVTTLSNYSTVIVSVYLYVL